MVVTLVALVEFARSTLNTFRDPTTRGLVVGVGFVLGGGTVFYSQVESWSIVDSLYFCAITLATIGYGDLVPTKDASKILTIVYLFVGIGVLASFITTVARQTSSGTRLRRSGEGPPASAAGE